MAVHENGAIPARKSRSRLKNERARCGEAYQPTDLEQFANCASHGVAVVPSVWGAVCLLRASDGGAERAAACAFGVATVVLLLSSTVYHAAELVLQGRRRRARFWLHVCDRSCIYMFIASAAWPWLLLRESGSLGRVLRSAIWPAALAGCLYQYLFHERFKRLETCLYILMSLSMAPAALFMEERGGLMTLACGGSVYLLGVCFFKADGLIPFAHAIWHLHVLVVQLGHFITILGTMMMYSAIYSNLMSFPEGQLNRIEL